jgi:hypothetical protein
MNFDISGLLEQWDYQAGQLMVRRFKTPEDVEKIQLRVDLGILQMNAEGRPDGKKPMGHPSLYDYHKARLYKHITEHDGSDEGFALKAEDCSKLQLEALQYHHRYICLLQLDDYPLVIRDTERNLEVFDFVEQYADNEELAWSFLQFRPQLLLIHTRARATQSLEADDYPGAIQQIEEGIERLRDFYQENMRHEQMEQSSEIQSLERWVEELNEKRPLSKREKLERALDDAVKREDYEKAARMRDALRNLKSAD